MSETGAVSRSCSEKKKKIGIKYSQNSRESNCAGVSTLRIPVMHGLSFTGFWFYRKWILNDYVQDLII